MVFLSMKILLFGNIIFTKELLKKLLKRKKFEIYLITKKKSLNSDHVNFSEFKNKINIQKTNDSKKEKKIIIEDDYTPSQF